MASPSCSRGKASVTSARGVGEEEGRAHALHDAPQDQLGPAAGEARAQRGEREDDEAADVGVLAPEEVRQPPRGEDEHRRGDHVGEDHPHELEDAGAQRALEVGQGDDQGARVDRRQQHAQAGARQRPPLVVRVLGVDAEAAARKRRDCGWRKVGHRFDYSRTSFLRERQVDRSLADLTVGDVCRLSCRGGTKPDKRARAERERATSPRAAGPPPSVPGRAVRQAQSGRGRAAAPPRLLSREQPPVGRLPAVLELELDRAGRERGDRLGVEGRALPGDAGHELGVGRRARLSTASSVGAASPHATSSSSTKPTASPTPKRPGGVVARGGRHRAGAHRRRWPRAWRRRWRRRRRPGSGPRRRPARPAASATRPRARPSRPARRRARPP